MLEKTLESPLDCKEIQPVHSEGDQPWDFFGSNEAKAGTPVLWPPHAKSWLIGKDSDAGRDWGQEEKGMTEDEMAGWHHWLDECESEWTLGVGDGQGGLACCDSWGRKELDTTERLIWSDLILCPTEFCVIWSYLIWYILFHWSGPPVCAQLVFCMHFCVWRCILDVSMERDVLHVHLLLCHHVLLLSFCFLKPWFLVFSYSYGVNTPINGWF